MHPQGLGTSRTRLTHHHRGRLLGYGRPFAQSAPVGRRCRGCGPSIIARTDCGLREYKGQLGAYYSVDDYPLRNGLRRILRRASEVIGNYYLSGKKRFAGGLAMASLPFASKRRFAVLLPEHARRATSNPGLHPIAPCLQLGIAFPAGGAVGVRTACRSQTSSGVVRVLASLPSCPICAAEGDGHDVGLRVRAHCTRCRSLFAGVLLGNAEL
jgi:hypothetical protein